MSDAHSIQRALVAALFLSLPVLLLGAVATPACGGAQSQVSPYSAQQWRDATSEGRSYRYRIEVPRHRDRSERELVFGLPDERGVTIRSTTYLHDGYPAVRPPQQARVAWSDLVRKTRYPGHKTVVRPAYIQTAAGDFEAQLYIVRERNRRGQTKVTRVWFADALPGAALRHEVEIDGQVVSRLVIIARTPGS